MYEFFCLPIILDSLRINVSLISGIITFLASYSVLACINICWTRSISRMSHISILICILTGAGISVLITNIDDNTMMRLIIEKYS